MTCHQNLKQYKKYNNKQRQRKLEQLLQDEKNRELNQKNKNVWKSFEKKKSQINKKLRQQKQKVNKKTKINNIKKKIKNIDTHNIMKQSKREKQRRQHDKKQKQKGKKLTKTLHKDPVNKNNKQRDLSLEDEHVYHLKNFDFQNPQIDYDFLNGQNNVQDYHQVVDEEYSIQESIEYLQVLQLKLDNCYQISKGNTSNDQFFQNPKLKFCQVDFVFEIHILRNVYFKLQQKICELIPEVVIIEDIQYTRIEFFQYIMQLEVLNYKDVILPILKTQMQLEEMVMWDIKYYQLVQNIFRIRKIVQDFQQIEYFAQRFHKKGLVVFIEGFEKEMMFLTEVQTLVNVYSQTEQGQTFLEEQKHQFKMQLKKTNKKDRKLAIQEQTQIQKLLDNKEKTLDEMIVEEQEFLNQVEQFNEDLNLKFKTLPQIQYDAILQEIIKSFPIKGIKKNDQQNQKDPFKKMQIKIQKNPIQEKAVIRIIVNKKDVEKYKNFIRKVLKIQPERKAISIDKEIKQTQDLHNKIKIVKEKNIARQLKQQDRYIKRLHRLKHNNIIQII